jgi:hypothetical protein
VTTHRADGTSSYDEFVVGPWPPRRVIWSCQQSRGKLLTRYFLLRTARLGIYLHHLHTSDEDGHLHDHPWAFITVLLSAGYFEWTPKGVAWRRRFSVLHRPAAWSHRLELIRPTWTLVFRFRRCREWGFFTKAGWLDWRTYGQEWCD